MNNIIRCLPHATELFRYNIVSCALKKKMIEFFGVYN